MADEARLIFELQDKSGYQGGTPSPGQQNQATTPQSLADLFNEFKRLINQPNPSSQPSSGQPSSPTSIPPQAVPTQPAVPVPTPGGQPTDPLYKTVAGIYGADPNVTAIELQKTLQITIERAKELLDAAKGLGKGVPVGKPYGIFGPDPFDPLIFPKDSQQILENRWVASEQGRFEREFKADQDRIRQEQQQAQDKARTPPPLTRNQQLEESERRAPPIQIPYAEAVDENGKPATAPRTDPRVQGAVNSLASLASLGGPLVGSIGQTAATLTAQFPALSAALAPLASAAPYLAVGTAAVAVPTVAALTLRNEAERAIGLSSGYSAELALSQAQAEVRQVMANIRTARRLGDEGADYTDATSRIGASSQGIRDVLAEPVLQRLNTVLGTIATFLEKYDKFLTDNPKYAEGLQKQVGFLTDRIAEIFLLPGGMSYLRMIHEALDKQNKKEDDIAGNPFLWLASQVRKELPDPFTKKDAQPRQFTISNLPPGLELVK